MKKAWKSKLLVIVCLMSLFTLTNTVVLKAQTTFDTAICWSATKQINFPVYHIAANPNDRKLFFYNTLNAHQTGIFVCDMDNDNDSTVFIGLQSPVGEVVHNPFTNQMLISQNSEAIPARVKVLNDSLVFENDIELSGVSHATNMYIAENGLLYIAANMYDNTPKIFVLDAQTYQPVSGSPFEVNGLIPASGYYDIFSADFCYNPYNQKVYATFTTNNTTVPSDIESYNSLDPYFSALNSSLLSASPTTTFPGILVEISEAGISTLLSDLNGPRELLCATPADASGDNQGALYINAADLIRYDCQTGNTLYFAGLDLNDITYNSNQNCLYGFRDTYVGEGNPLDEHPSHRLTEVYRVQDGQGTSTLLYTYDGQSASLVSNPYDGMLYLQTKVDADRLGAQPMQVIRLQPNQANQEPPSVSLHHRGFCPELDVSLDYHYVNYNLTTPYIDPYQNKMYLPNGGHSSVSKVEFEPNESLPLNPGEYAWLSFPRLTRTANNAVPVNEVLFDNIDPEDYESQSELVNLPPTSYNEISNFFSGTQWPSNADLTHIQSTLGYKLKLLYNYTPEKKQVQLHGNVLSQDEPLNIYKDHDNWVGYWLYTSQSPFDAFPENVLDELTVIKAQTWCCVKRWELADGMLTPHWLCAVHKDKVTLDYGDMVILETNADLSFKWQNTGIPFTKESKMDAQYYSFTEEADYISFFIELDSTENPKEVGAFIGETCIGATTVWPEDTVVLVPGYAEGMSGEVVFKEYYDDFKSANAIKSEYLVADNTNGNWNRRTIHTHENQGHYFISFGSEAENWQTTDDFQITIYPNPANNWLYINYRLDEPSNIEIQVIDGFGRQVATLLYNTQPKGDYAMQWNLTDAHGKKLTPGIYVLNIIENGRVVTKKLVIY